MQPGDLAEIDADYLSGLEWWLHTPVDNLDFEALDFPCTTPSASGKTLQVLPGQQRVTASNREEYVKTALQIRLHEFDQQVAAIREVGCLLSAHFILQEVIVCHSSSPWYPVLSCLPLPLTSPRPLMLGDGHGYSAATADVVHRKRTQRDGVWGN